MNPASDPLWTGLGLVSPLQAWVHGRLPTGVSGVSIDTRTLAEGDLFFAVERDGSDGHDHVAEAFEAGAAAAVVNERHADALAGAGPLYIVKDVRRSLDALGRAGRTRTQARIIAFTGPVGISEALHLTLATAGSVHVGEASCDDALGVPLTLARMPKATRFAFAEIGPTGVGEIAPLAALVRPHVAIVGAAEPAVDAQVEIFSGLEPGGVAILDRDHPHYDRLDEAARASPAGHISTFGAHEAAEARLLAHEPDAGHARVEAIVAGREIGFRLGTANRRIAETALAALLAAHALGADIEAAAAALASLQAADGGDAQAANETPEAPDPDARPPAAPA